MSDLIARRSSLRKIHGGELVGDKLDVGFVGRNHFVDTADIGMLFAGISAGTIGIGYNPTDDDKLDHSDLTHLIETILETRFGDAI